MAAFYGINNTKYFQTVPAEKINPGEQNGRIFIARDVFVGTLDSASSDYAEMMKLPKGARILDAKIYASAPSAGTACQMDVGLDIDADGGSADVDRLIDGVDSGSAAVIKGMMDGGAGVVGAAGGTADVEADGTQIETPFAKLDQESTVRITALNTWSGEATVDLTVMYTVE